MVCFSLIKVAQLDKNFYEVENSCSHPASLFFANSNFSKPIFNLKNSGETNHTIIAHYINA